MKLRFVILLVLLAVLLTSCYPSSIQSQDTRTTSTPAPTNEGVADRQSYVGVVYPPYPEPVIFQEGGSIYPSKHNLKWSVARVTDKHSNMLWLSKVVTYDENGIPKHEVSDVIVLPLEKERSVVAISTCLLSGVIDPEIVVLAKWDENVFTTRFLPNENILLAWRVNQTTGKFEELAKQNIECVFE